MDRYEKKKKTPNPVLHRLAKNCKMLELEEPLETIRCRAFILQGMKLKYKLSDLPSVT